MTPPRRTLSFQQITQWLVAHSPMCPTTAEVEGAIESLVEQGIIETLWDENGTVSYRLTRDGFRYASGLSRQEGW
jgi:DNA-binding PadR family transcriptional regulator